MIARTIPACGGNLSRHMAPVIGYVDLNANGVSREPFGIRLRTMGSILHRRRLDLLRSVPGISEVSEEDEAASKTSRMRRCLVAVPFFRNREQPQIEKEY